MVRKKKTNKAAEEAAAAKAAEEAATAKAAEEAAAAKAAEPKVLLPEGWVMVMAKRADLFDPFQQKKFPQGIKVPTELTSWIDCQIKAGVLIEVSEQ